jgi:hypothetical protein
MNHNARTDACVRPDDTRTDSNDDPTRLVSSNNRPPSYVFRLAVKVQIAAAHAGCLDLQNNLTDAWRWIRESRELESTVSTKDNATHVLISSSVLVQRFGDIGAA